MLPWNETLSAVSDFTLLKAQSYKKKNKTKQKKTIKTSATLTKLNNTKINIYNIRKSTAINERVVPDLLVVDLDQYNCDAVRKAREADLIHKGNTLSPLGINRRGEAH